MKRRSFDDWALLALGLAALVATVLGTLAVVSRYVFSVSFGFSDELITYVVVWSLLIGVGLGERDNVHLRATIVIDRLSPRTQRWLARLTLLLTAVFGLVLVWYGGMITWQRYTLNEVSATILQFPQWMARISVPLGFAMVTWSALCHLRRPLEIKTEAL